MSHVIIDRTGGGKNKSSPNREKFMKRSTDALKKAVKEYIINDGDIKSISDGKSKNIKINNKTLSEPEIVYDSDVNDYDAVAPGNKSFERGDTISKPSKRGGKGRGKGGSNTSETLEDEYYFTLTHQEFLDIFFGDLELPDLIKKSLLEEPNYELRPAGFTTDGPPSRLDLRKTMLNSLRRSFSVNSSIQNDIDELEERMKSNDLSDVEKQVILAKLKELVSQQQNIPFLQELDLRYRKYEPRPIPSTKAVMFCVMDVSYSMSEWHKEMAKRFFMMLYLFLTKEYENVELVFVKHHHEAFEVSEQDFFYSRSSGGTVVSKALQLVLDIINKRYDNTLFNIYVCQISDGDDYGASDEYVAICDVMDKLMPKLQYFAYIEVEQNSMQSGLTTPIHVISSQSKKHSVLMEMYKSISQGYKKLNIRKVTSPKGIYSVFRSLFTKKNKGSVNEQAA